MFAQSQSNGPVQSLGVVTRINPHAFSKETFFELSPKIMPAFSVQQLSEIISFRNESYTKHFPELSLDGQDPFDLQSITFFTRDKNNAITSTARFVIESSWGLPEDSLLKAEIDPLRAEGRNLASIGRFVNNHCDVQLLREYYRVFYVTAKLLSIDSIVLLVRNKELKFYQNRVGAQIIKTSTGRDYGGAHEFSGVLWHINETKRPFVQWMKAEEIEVGVNHDE